MALNFPSRPIWLATQPVDFRKALNGLLSIIVEAFNVPPGDGIYIFYNKGRDKIKLVLWDENGFVLVYKRLERQRFVIPRFSSEVLKNTTKLLLDKTELMWLLQGMDWQCKRRKKSEKYTYFS